MEWWCEGEDDKHAPLRFSTEEDFVAHWLQYHPSGGEPNITRDRIQRAGNPSLTPFTCCPFCDFLPDSLGQGDPFGPDTISRTAASQRALQDHIAEELLKIFLIALPEIEGVEDDVGETNTERSLETPFAVRLLSPEDNTIAFAEESIDMLPASQEGDAALISITDPGSINELWAAVWASLQLRHSVRESYVGPGHDHTIKHIAIHQNQEDQLEIAQMEYEVRIPGTYVNDEKSLSSRLIPQHIYGQNAGHDQSEVLVPDALDLSTTSSRKDLGFGSLQCEFCAKNFTRSSNLKRHIEKVHSDSEGRFYCPQVDCDFSSNGKMGGFRHADPLRVHMRSMHHLADANPKSMVKSSTNEPPKKWRCPGCSITLATERDLKKHAGYCSAMVVSL